MKVFGCILLPFILIILSHCSHSKPEAESTAALDEKVQQLLASRSIYGDWEDNSVFMYGARLTFYNNGTFEFRDYGCTQDCYSKGKWTAGDKFISITSFDEYGPGRPEHIPKYVTFEEKPSKRNHFKGVAYSIDTSTFYPEQRFRFDSMPVYFQNRKYLLINDTLLGIGGSTGKFVRK